MAKIKLSEEEYIKLLNNFDLKLNEIKDIISQIYTNVNALQQANNAGDPFWNGSNAKQFYEDAVVAQRKTISAYKEIRDVLTILDNKYLNLLRKGRFKA